MNLRFIITSYNVAAYIDRCLESVLALLRDGDRVLIIDDASTDGTAEYLSNWISASPERATVCELRLFGTHTPGGVGIAANTGIAVALADSDCEALFFVDGDDWLDPSGFARCRTAFEASGAEILIGNYLTFDEATQKIGHPADTVDWLSLRDLPKGCLDPIRTLALKLIAVPWRKFYRADFLRREQLRFPEGNFFYEDNPFHWEVCLKARSIELCNFYLCYHRINRIGQTMSEAGVELIAFFEHFETILTHINGWRSPHAIIALHWLWNNMTWHVARLHPYACWPYAARAVSALASIPESLWVRARASFDPRNSIPYQLEALRRNDLAAIVACWQQDARARQVNTQLKALSSELCEIRSYLEQIRHQSAATAEIARFKALCAVAACQDFDEAVDF